MHNKTHFSILENFRPFDSELRDTLVSGPVYTAHPVIKAENPDFYPLIHCIANTNRNAN